MAAHLFRIYANEIIYESAVGLGITLNIYKNKTEKINRSYKSVVKVELNLIYTQMGTKLNMCQFIRTSYAL